jgi:DNA-binding transcriptional MerR regulator
MAHTVKQLAQLSGVSIRTLRFYDEIGILKPAYYGNNGYRFYEEEQLLILQQILFYRELGFTLNDIQHALHSNDFNKISALISHRSLLQKKLDRIQKLITTLDKTISTLNGEISMSANEIYDGFDPIDLPKYDEMAINKFGDLAVKLIEYRNEVTKNWGKTEWDKLHQDWNELSLEFTAALKNNLSPASQHVQSITKKQYQHLKKLYAPSKIEYLYIGEMNCTNPEYKKQFDFYHPDLAEFIQAAMIIFAENKESDLENLDCFT